jgi:hypothetical protein
MRYVATVTLLLAFWLMVPLAEAKVVVDYDTKADFSAYATFAWKPGTHAKNSLMHKRIVTAVEDQLASVGLRKTDGRPDLYVVYHTALRTARKVHVDDYGYWRRWRGSAFASVDVYDVKVGTLIVDLIDGTSGDAVWRGIAERELSGKPTPEKIEKRLRKILKKLFRDFPPE